MTEQTILPEKQSASLLMGSLNHFAAIKSLMLVFYFVYLNLTKHEIHNITGEAIDSSTYALIESYCQKIQQQPQTNIGQHNLNSHHHSKTLRLRFRPAK